MFPAGKYATTPCRQFSAAVLFPGCGFGFFFFVDRLATNNVLTQNHKIFLSSIDLKSETLFYKLQDINFK
jgi:hypothetical protein